MRNRCTAVLCCSLLSLQMMAQSAPASNQAAPATAPATAAKLAMTGFGLEDGTPVKLRTNRTVSSSDAKVGDTLDFEVLEEVRVKGVLLVPKGGLAWATVTEAQSKRRMGRGGKLDINIDSVRLVDGEKAALRAVKDMQGGGHVGAMTGAIVATSLVFFPAAPFFLFMHGKDISIPKGTEVTAYVNGDTPLELAKFEVSKSETVATAPVAPELQKSTLEITSDPSGADIEADGKFIGNTPSTLPMPPGEHTFTISRPGFAPWQRTLTLTGGNIKLGAILVPAPPQDANAAPAVKP